MLKNFSFNRYQQRLMPSTSISTKISLLVLGTCLITVTNAFGQFGGSHDVQANAQSLQQQEQLKQITENKASYVAAIVSRWEESARTSGKFDENYSTDLSMALMKMSPSNLLAAGEAASYQEVLAVLAGGARAKANLKAAQPDAVSPEFIGDTFDDLVYTPVAQCRIVDTRNAGGAIIANTNRSFDVDGTTFVAQGGVNTSCGIPFGVARAVTMIIHTLTPTATGVFYAWPLGLAQPTGAVLNFVTGQNLANTAIVSVAPGSGTDFWLRSTATSQVTIDVVGYFAAPVSTALNCTSVASSAVAVAVNAWTPVDVSCPVGTTATGGGFDTTEGTLGFPGVWITSVPNGNGWRAWVDNQTNGPRHVLAWATCCRVPGR